MAVGRQTYPDYSSIAAPAHESVEKDRVHLMVSLMLQSTPGIRTAEHMRRREIILAQQKTTRPAHIASGRAGLTVLQENCAYLCIQG